MPGSEPADYRRGACGDPASPPGRAVRPSLAAGTTSGIEPMFALTYTRHMPGRQLPGANPLFERLTAAFTPRT
jgi:hypothetical protein